MDTGNVLQKNFVEIAVCYLKEPAWVGKIQALCYYGHCWIIEWNWFK